MLYSIEILPNQFDDFVLAHRPFEAWLPRSSLRVFVPHINGTPYLNVLTCCDALMNQGYTAVPHVAARNFKSEDSFAAMTETFTRVGIQAILLLGGDNPEPSYYTSVTHMLDQSSAVFDSLRISEIYLGTFPDGHPHTSETEAFANIAHKCNWAKQRGCQPYLISQVAFRPQSIEAHLDKLAAHGIHAPLCLGCAGQTSLPGMIKIAKLVGLYSAVRLANRHNLIKLLTQYKFDSFTQPLLASGRLAGMHIYPFGNYNWSVKKLVELVQQPTTTH